MTRLCAWCDTPATTEVEVTPSEHKTVKGKLVETRLAVTWPACPQHATPQRTPPPAGQAVQARHRPDDRVRRPQRPRGRVMNIAETDAIVRRDLAHWLRVPAHEIDDAMQEAWLRYAIHASRLDQTNVAGWLWVVARHEYYNQYRTRQREQPMASPPDAGSDSDLAEIIDFRDAVARIHGAARYGITYKLLGLSYDQVHDTTLFTRRSIERHIRRGRAALAQELAA